MPMIMSHQRLALIQGHVTSLGEHKYVPVLSLSKAAYQRRRRARMVAGRKPPEQTPKVSANLSRNDDRGERPKRSQTRFAEQTGGRPEVARILRERGREVLLEREREWESLVARIEEARAEGERRNRGWRATFRPGDERNRAMWVTMSGVYADRDKRRASSPTESTVSYGYGRTFVEAREAAEVVESTNVWLARRIEEEERKRRPDDLVGSFVVPEGMGGYLSGARVEVPRWLQEEMQRGVRGNVASSLWEGRGAGGRKGGLASARDEADMDRKVREIVAKNKNLLAQPAEASKKAKVKVEVAMDEEGPKDVVFKRRKRPGGK